MHDTSWLRLVLFHRTKLAFGLFVFQGPHGPICDGNVLHGAPQLGMDPITGQGIARHTLQTAANQPGSWIDFALREQRYGIQSDQALNWITMFGTHNSFSSYGEGDYNVYLLNNSLADSPSQVGLNMNVDQYFSVYDQMDAGARFVRLDPISYGVTDYLGALPFVVPGTDTELRMCHQSATSNSGTEGECMMTSYGRLFGYGLDEVSNFLQQNPEEVVVLRLNRTQSADYALIDNALNNELAPLEPHLPGFSILKPTSWDPTAEGWKTPREMRTSGERVVVLSDQQSFQVDGTNGQPILSYNHPFTYYWNDWVLNDGYSDSTGFAQCQNTPIGYPTITTPAIDVSTRGFNQWAYIGEDRSGSNAFSVPQGPAYGGAGLLSDSAVQHATECGFGLLAVDFLLAGQYPAQSSITIPDISLGFTFPSWIPVIGGESFRWDDNFSLKPFNYTFGADHRRESSIWSFDTNDMGTGGPAYLKPMSVPSPSTPGRWGSQPAYTSANFACAVNPGSSSTPVNYQWIVSPTSGPWTNGPQVCAALGATFWAPQSAVENNRLIAVANQTAPGANVWLNYLAQTYPYQVGGPVLEPATAGLTAVSGSPTNFTLNLFQGQDAGALQNIFFQYTGGLGGPLSINSQSLEAGSSSNPTNSPASLDSRHKRFVLNICCGNGVVDSHNRIALAPGAYPLTFIVSETGAGLEGSGDTSTGFFTYTLTTTSARRP